MFLSKKLMLDTDNASFDYYTVKPDGEVIVTTVTIGGTRQSSLRPGSIVSPGTHVAYSSDYTLPVSANDTDVYVLFNGSLYRFEISSGDFLSTGGVNNTTSVTFCVPQASSTENIMLTRYAYSSKTVKLNKISVSKVTGVATVTNLRTQTNTSSNSGSVACVVKSGGVYESVFNYSYRASATQVVTKWCWGADREVTGLGAWMQLISDNEFLYFDKDNAKLLKKGTFTGSGVSIATYCTLEDDIRAATKLYEDGKIISGVASKTIQITGEVNAGWFSMHDATTGARIWKTDPIEINSVPMSARLLGKYKDYYYGIIVPYTSSSTEKAYLVQLRPSDGVILMKKEIIVPENDTPYACFSNSQYVPVVSGNGYFVVGKGGLGTSCNMIRIKIKQGASHNRKPTL